MFNVCGQLRNNYLLFLLRQGAGGATVVIANYQEHGTGPMLFRAHQAYHPSVVGKLVSCLSKIVHSLNSWGYALASISQDYRKNRLDQYSKTFVTKGNRAAARSTRKKLEDLHEWCEETRWMQEMPKSTQQMWKIGCVKLKIKYLPPIDRCPS